MSATTTLAYHTVHSTQRFMSVGTGATGDILVGSPITLAILVVILLALCLGIGWVFYTITEGL